MTTFLRKYSLSITLWAAAGGIVAGNAAYHEPERFESTVQLSTGGILIAADRSLRVGPVSGPDTSEALETLVKSDPVLRKVVVRKELGQSEDFLAQKSSWIEIGYESVGGFLRKLKQRYFDGADPEEASSVPEVASSTNRAMAALGQMIEVEHRAGESSFDIRVSAAQPGLAHDLAAALGYAVIEELEDARTAFLTAEAGRRDEQIVALYDRLSGSEKALNDYVTKNGLENADAEMSRDTLRIANLDFELVNVQTELKHFEAIYARAQDIRATGGDTDAVLAALDLYPPAPGEAQERATGAQISARDITGGPPNDEDRSQTTRSESEGDGDAIGPALAGVALRIDTLNQVAGELETELAAVIDRSASMQSMVQVMEDLQDVVEQDRAAYDAFMSGLSSDVGLQRISEATAQVAEPATWPTQPAAIPLLAFLTVGLFGGALLGTFTARVREGFARRARRADRSLVNLGLPVLMRVEQKYCRTDRWPLPRFVNGVPQRARHRNQDDLRKLWREVVSPSADGRAPILLLSSLGVAPDKTDLAAELALSADAVGLSVLLVDADLQQARLSQDMGCHLDEGLTELVETGSWDLSGVRPGMSVVDVMPTGLRLSETAKVLGSAQLARFFEAARAHYDIIVVDGPSDARSQELAALSRFCDTTCLVISDNVECGEEAVQAINKLGSNNILGVVLTNVINSATGPNRSARKSAFASDRSTPQRRGQTQRAGDAGRLAGVKT